MKHWPFKVIEESSTQRPRLEVEYRGETKTFYAEEISSMVLLKMKETAEAYLGLVNIDLLDRIELFFLFMHVYLPRLISGYKLFTFTCYGIWWQLSAFIPDFHVADIIIFKHFFLIYRKWQMLLLLYQPTSMIPRDMQQRMLVLSLA